MAPIRPVSSPSVPVQQVGQQLAVAPAATQVSVPKAKPVAQRPLSGSSQPSLIAPQAQEHLEQALSRQSSTGLARRSQRIPPPAGLQQSLISSSIAQADKTYAQAQGALGLDSARGLTRKVQTGQASESEQQRHQALCETVSASLENLKNQPLSVRQGLSHQPEVNKLTQLAFDLGVLKGGLPGGDPLTPLRMDLQQAQDCLDNEDFEGAIASVDQLNQRFIDMPDAEKEVHQEAAVTLIGEGQYIRKIAEFNLNPAAVAQETELSQISGHDLEHIQDRHCQGLQFSYDNMGDYSGPGQLRDDFVQQQGGLQGIAQTVFTQGDWSQLHSEEYSGHYFEAYHNFNQQVGAQVTGQDEHGFHGNPLKGVVIRGWADFENMTFQITTLFPRGTMKDENNQVIDRYL